MTSLTFDPSLHLDSRAGISALMAWARSCGAVLNETHAAIARKYGVSIDGVRISRPIPVEAGANIYQIANTVTDRVAFDPAHILEAAAAQHFSEVAVIGRLADDVWVSSSHGAGDTMLLIEQGKRKIIEASE